jgi:hypothetical protein
MPFTHSSAYTNATYSISIIFLTDTGVTFLQGTLARRGTANARIPRQPTVSMHVISKCYESFQKLDGATGVSVSSNLTLDFSTPSEAITSSLRKVQLSQSLKISV